MRVHLGLITVLPEKAAWNKYSTRVMMYVCIVCIDEKRREKSEKRKVFKTGLNNRVNERPFPVRKSTFTSTHTFGFFF